MLQKEERDVMGKDGMRLEVGEAMSVVYGLKVEERRVLGRML